MRLPILACTLFFISWCLPALALDCSLAKTPAEKCLCSAPTLRELDTNLNSEFQLLLQHMPDSQKLVLRKDQRIWLKKRDQQDCSALASTLRERVEELQELGKIDFRRVRVVFEHPALYARETYPELLGLADAKVAQRLNQNLKKNRFGFAPCPAPKSASMYWNAGFAILALDANLFRYTRHRGYYCAGLAHPIYDRITATYSLRTGAEIRLFEHIFQPSFGSRELARWLLEKSAMATKIPEICRADYEADRVIFDFDVKNGNLLLESRGFAYAKTECGTTFVIPLAELKEYLRAESALVL